MAMTDNKDTIEISLAVLAELRDGQHWADAGERTWFQIVALLAVWIYGRLAGPRHNDPELSDAPRDVVARREDAR